MTSLPTEGNRGTGRVEAEAERAVAVDDPFRTRTGTLLGSEEALIDRDRLMEYVLDPNHTDGGHKALVFDRVLGFNRLAVDRLIASIREGIRPTPAIFGKINQYGSHFRVDLLLTGPNGRQATVRSNWVFRPGRAAPELMTVFVRRRRNNAEASIP